MSSTLQVLSAVQSKKIELEGEIIKTKQNVTELHNDLIRDNELVTARMTNYEQNTDSRNGKVWIDINRVQEDRKIVDHTFDDKI
jgi:hypothetical protein